MVKEESEGMETPEGSMTIIKPKWDQALPSQIHAVLEEFDDEVDVVLTVVRANDKARYRVQVSKLGKNRGMQESNTSSLRGKL